MLDSDRRMRSPSLTMPARRPSISTTGTALILFSIKRLAIYWMLSVRIDRDDVCRHDILRLHLILPQRHQSWQPLHFIRSGYRASRSIF